MKLLTKLFFLLFICQMTFAQRGELRIEPPFWWANMKNDTLQLMVSGKDISKARPTINYSGVEVLGASSLESPNYLFVNLLISKKAKAGRIPIVFNVGKRSTTFHYELKERNMSADRIQGFNSTDLIYLIMPDRFANGDVKNDNAPGFLEKAARNEGYGRHGGDLKGISEHLDYVKELGATAIWINPVLENNMPQASYHGYAITDLYKIDARFGTNQDYVNLVEKCHQQGIKVIMDMVHNHIGLHHCWMKDLPSKNWINQFEEFTRSNYHLATNSDPHASELDKKLMERGWFDTSMPDLNQENPYLAKYLIQNSIWWIEYSGMDGIRMDTYPYPNKEFMANWAKEVMDTYPEFKIVGEVWIHSPSMESYWLKESSDKFKYNSGLPSVTDFPVNDAILKALNDPAGWNEGIGKLYHTVAEDFLYNQPNDNVIFLDNHDMTRAYTAVGEDIKKFKQAIAILMTMRGIPQLYYGTEILMAGDAAEHSEVRKDFPGGWSGDTKSAFTKDGRTKEENEAFDYVKSLAQWRKAHPNLMKGKLTHFIPEENSYVYFRHSDNESIMVILNVGNKAKTLDGKRFQERLKGFSSGREVTTGKIFQDLKEIEVEGNSVLVLELVK